jgi:hypothetical protein
MIYACFRSKKGWSLTVTMATSDDPPSPYCWRRGSRRRSPGRRLCCLSCRCVWLSFTAFLVEITVIHTYIYTAPLTHLSLLFSIRIRQLHPFTSFTNRRPNHLFILFTPLNLIFRSPTIPRSSFF